MVSFLLLCHKDPVHHCCSRRVGCASQNQRSNHSGTTAVVWNISRPVLLLLRDRPWRCQPTSAQREWHCVLGNGARSLRLAGRRRRGRCRAGGTGGQAVKLCLSLDKTRLLDVICTSVSFHALHIGLISMLDRLCCAAWAARLLRCEWPLSVTLHARKLHDLLIAAIQCLDY